MTEILNNSPPPVQARRLLEHCRERTTSFAEAQLTELFENAGAALLGFAERAQSNAVQGLFFGAMNELQRHRTDVQRIFRRQIQVGFTRFSDAATAAAEYHSDTGDAGGTKLTLVSPEEIEESVAAENLTIKAKTACASDLYALSLRLAAVTGHRHLKVNQIPAGPHHLVDAYRAALAGLDVEVKAKIVLYALFDKFIIKQAKPFYGELNKDLAEAGVLPNLNPVRSQPAQRSVSARSSPRPQRSSDTTAANQTNEATSLGTELFNSIIELMSATRRTGHAAQTGSDPRAAATQARQVPPQVRAAAKETLVAVIDTIQTEMPSKATTTGIDGSSGFPNIGLDSGLVDRVKQVLHQERAQILRQVDRDKLSPTDGSIIDLIGMLFEYMLNDPILPNSAKALLSHLHTPYLKLALIDERLLADTNHPARKFLDKMVEAGSLWSDGQNPTRGIFPAMKTAVDRVLREFRKDVALFDELLQSVEQAMAEQQRRASKMEQRTREVAQGREKLRLAKQLATQQIGMLTHRHPLPQAVANFLSKAWLDDLVFVLLRDQQGESGADWQHAIAAADQLVQLFEPDIADGERVVRMRSIPKIRDEISLRVQRMGNYNHTAVDALLALLDDPQSWHSDHSEATDTPTSPADGCASATGSAKRWNTADLEGSNPSLDPTVAEATMIARLSKMRPGTWFEFASSGDGQAKRIKLAWISPLTSSCMFVDKSGIQAETRTLLALAQDILSGHARIVPRARLPFIDRALVSIRKVLQRKHEPGKSD